MNSLFSKPFVLSIGPQACGTEVLHDYFKQRTDVALPKVQEIFYFDRHMHRGADFYKSHFKDSETVKLFMELTTTAFDHPRAPQRVEELLGENIKLICPLRDPVDRAVAVYKHYLRYSIVKGDIREACAQAPQILFASRYTDHLENWLDHFSGIHFVSYEALSKRRSEALKALCIFLDLPFQDFKDSFKFPKIFMPLKRKQNGETDLNREDMSWLREQLSDEDTRLKSLIGDLNLSL